MTSKGITKDIPDKSGYLTERGVSGEDLREQSEDESHHCHPAVEIFCKCRETKNTFNASSLVSHDDASGATIGSSNGLRAGSER